MGTSSVWKIMGERDFGEPLLLITKINHYQGDYSLYSYTARLPEYGDGDNTKSINSKTLFRLVFKLIFRSMKRSFSNFFRINV